MTTINPPDALTADATYPGGYADLLPGPGKRRAYTGMADLLAPLLEAPMPTLWATPVDPPEHVPDRCDTAADKLAEIADEFVGRPIVLALHALTIAAARRNDPPAEARTLFLRIWRETPHEMIDALDTRWKLSALQTFALWGETEDARRAGATLTVFFQMLKLGESERLFSGFGPERTFRVTGAARGPLPLGLQQYSLRSGDLDRNLLGQLWLDAEADPVLRPLACHLLNALNREPRGLFHRLRRMRGRLAKRA